MLAAGRTPPARYEAKRCDACSLLELCRPKALEQPRRVAAWLARLVEERGMRRYLNTLYVQTEGARLRKDGTNLVVRSTGPRRAASRPTCWAGSSASAACRLSPPLLGFCCESGITVTWLSEHGRFLARVEGPVSGNVLLRREQYRRSDDPAACAALVRSFVLAKTLNQRYRTAISKAFRILIASDRRATDPADDTRLLESFPGGLPVRRRAGPRPTLRQHPATCLARGDQQDQAIAIRADTHWKGGILAV